MIMCVCQKLVRSAVIHVEQRRARMISSADAAFAVDGVGTPRDYSLAGSGVAATLLLARTRTTLETHRIAVGAHDDPDIADRDWSAAAAAVSTARAELRDDDDDEDTDDDESKKEEEEGGARGCTAVKEDEESKEGEAEAEDARTVAHHAQEISRRACQCHCAPASSGRCRIFHSAASCARSPRCLQLTLIKPRAFAMIGAAVESHVVRTFMLAATIQRAHKDPRFCTPIAAEPRSFQHAHRIFMEKA